MASGPGTSRWASGLAAVPDGAPQPAGLVDAAPGCRPPNCWPPPAKRLGRKPGARLGACAALTQHAPTGTALLAFHPRIARWGDATALQARLSTEQREQHLLKTSGMPAWARHRLAHHLHRPGRAAAHQRPGSTPPGAMGRIPHGQRPPPALCQWQSGERHAVGIHGPRQHITDLPAPCRPAHLGTRWPPCPATTTPAPA